MNKISQLFPNTIGRVSAGPKLTRAPNAAALTMLLAVAGGFHDRAHAATGFTPEETQISNDSRCVAQENKDAFAAHPGLTQRVGHAGQRFLEYGLEVGQFAVVVDPTIQKAILVQRRLSEQGQTLIQPYCVWDVSTSAFGIGNRRNSQQTPYGMHKIGQYCGTNEPIGALFGEQCARTGVVLTDLRRSGQAARMTTRIMYLEGIEKEVNMGTGENDTGGRGIALHGTDREQTLGVLTGEARGSSHGCGRMDNSEVTLAYDVAINQEGPFLVEIINPYSPEYFAVDGDHR